MRNILVISSAKQFEQSLADLFKDLSGDNYFFSWIGGQTEQQFGAAAKKMFFGTEAKNFWGTAAFTTALPLLWLVYFFILSFFLRRNKIEKIVCVNDEEKIIFTPLGRLLNLAVYWLELPGKNQPKAGLLRRVFSGQAELVTFTSQAAEDLAKAGLKKEKIHNISLGVNLQSVERQDNLFSGLAKADKPHSFYKNFTVGAIVDNGDRRRLEILLQASRSCANLIPNFRLVVIGQDTSSGNLNWLIKNLGLQHQVWLVGEQKNLLQWLDDLDLYVILAENPGLDDLEKALAAASRGIPLLSFAQKNLADILSDGQNGLVSESVSAEALAQKIIALEADDRIRRQMGAFGRQMVYAYFDRQKQIERLRKIID